MIIYKIRHISDGLYSTGGETPRFNTKGKVWNAYGHVTSHLTQVHSKTKVYANAEVVSFELTESEKETIPVSEWKEKPSTTRAKELEQIRSRERELERAQKTKARLEKELADLNKKLNK